jgi:hypothetical protein
MASRKFLLSFEFWYIYTIRTHCRELGVSCDPIKLSGTHFRKHHEASDVQEEWFNAMGRYHALASGSASQTFCFIELRFY